MKKLIRREEVKEEDKWRIEDLFETIDQWELEYEQVEELRKRLGQYKGILTNSAVNLYSFLELKDACSKLLERVYVYANQKYHEDTTNAIYQNLSGKATSLARELDNTISFAEPEILTLDIETIEQYKLQVSELNIYSTYLEEIICKKGHILSDEMESLLTLSYDMSNVASDIYSMFQNADLIFPTIQNEEGEEIQITHGRFLTLMQSTNREVRKSTFHALYHTYQQFSNSLAAMYQGSLKKELFFARARNYPCSLERVLYENHIPVIVYKNLIQAVQERLDLMHRYVGFRKKVLKLEELHMYDLYVPLISEVDMKISFSEASKLVQKGLQPLGKEYGEILEEGLKAGWIDRYENVGKRSGAYCWGVYGVHPYVLLNYEDNLNSAFTLAHEMGHAVHTYYSNQTQPYIYAGYKIFVAEVASTCNEALFMQSLLENTTNKKEKFYLLNYFLEQFKNMLYRQTMFAEFELLTHESVQQGEVLTAKRLCELYHNLNRQYFGDNLIIDPEIDMEWSRIPHFYQTFYVYQYAIGYSAAMALCKKILEEGESAVCKYIAFLKSGSSKTPIELLKEAGVDMTTNQPIHAALDVFESLLDQIEAMYNEELREGCE